MIAQNSEARTWAHGLPAGAKMLALLVAGAAAMLAGRAVLPLILGLAAVAGLFLSCGMAFARAGLRAVRPILIVAAVIALWHLWWRGDAIGGAAVALRLALLVAMAAFVTMTTAISEMTALAERLMARLRLPADLRGRIALAMALAIRFIPVLSQKGAILSEAWRARATRRLSPKIVLPLALLAIDDAEQVAEALRARSAPK